MKKLLSLVAALALFASPALAGIGGTGSAIIWFNSPNTISNVLIAYCNDGNIATDLDNGIWYGLTNCNTVPVASQIWPPAASSVSGLSGLLAAKFSIPTGFTTQYVRGDGSLATFPTAVSAFTNDAGYLTSSSLSPYLLSSTAASTYFAKPTGSASQYLDGVGTPKSFPSWTFQNGSHALNSCFQVSSTQDANFTYSVDINATLTLGGGTGTVTSYTNSGCTTGAQVIGQGAVSSVALGGTSSIPMTAWLPAGKWAKITASASGGGTAALDSVQPEALKL